MFVPQKVVQDAILSSIVKFQHIFYNGYTYKANYYVSVSTTKTTLLYFSPIICVRVSVQEHIDI